MLSKPGDDFWCRPLIVLNVLGCPSSKGDARLECVEREPSFVVLGGAGEGEQGGRDETTCCLSAGQRGCSMLDAMLTVSATEMVSLLSLSSVATSWTIDLSSSGGKVVDDMLIARLKVLESFKAGRRCLHANMSASMLRGEKSSSRGSFMT
jgi:hypothetical protein